LSLELKQVPLELLLCSKGALEALVDEGACGEDVRVGQKVSW